MDASSLARLRPELCNTIWEMVLVKQYSIDFSCPEPLLTAVCRQIRSEWTQMYYSVSDFSVSRLQFQQEKVVSSIHRVPIEKLQLMLPVYAMHDSHCALSKIFRAFLRGLSWDDIRWVDDFGPEAKHVWLEAVQDQSKVHGKATSGALAAIISTAAVVSLPTAIVSVLAVWRSLK